MIQHIRPPTPSAFSITSIEQPELKNLIEVFRICQLTNLSPKPAKKIWSLITALSDEIDSKLFPIYEPLTEDFTDSNDHPWLKSIQPRLMGIDRHNSSSDDYGEPIKLFWLISLLLDDAGYRIAEQIYSEYPFTIYVPWKKDLEKGLDALRANKAIYPLNHLRDLWDMATWQTGTWYLDTCPTCDAPELKWSKENVDFLCEDWARANVILQRKEAIVAWVKKDKQNLPLLWKHLKDAIYYRETT